MPAWRGMTLRSLACTALLLAWTAGISACGGGSSTDATPQADAGADAATTDGAAACGCDTTSEFCYATLSGKAPRSATPGCNALPAACASDVTCDCVLSNGDFACGVAPTCVIADSGEVQVSCSQ